MAPSRSQHLQVCLSKDKGVSMMERQQKRFYLLFSEVSFLQGTSKFHFRQNRGSFVNVCVSKLKGLMYDRPSGFHDVHHAWKGDKDWRGPPLPQTALPDAIFQRNTSVCCDLCLIMKLSLIASAELIRDLYFYTSIPPLNWICVQGRWFLWQITTVECRLI